MDKATRHLLEAERYPDGFPWDRFKTFESLGMGSVFYKIWKAGYDTGRRNSTHEGESKK